MKKWIASVVVSALLVTTTGPASAREHEEVADGRMFADVLVARPVGLVLTVAGAAAFVVSLPLTLITRSVNKAAKTLVVGPARETFVRCLGCVTAGRTAAQEAN